VVFEDKSDGSYIATLVRVCVVFRTQTLISTGGFFQVYDVSEALCPGVFPGYNKLKNSEKVEWNNRCALLFVFTNLSYLNCFKSNYT